MYSSKKTDPLHVRKTVAAFCTKEKSASQETSAGGSAECICRCHRGPVSKRHFFIYLSMPPPTDATLCL